MKFSIEVYGAELSIYANPIPFWIKMNHYTFECFQLFLNSVFQANWYGFVEHMHTDQCPQGDILLFIILKFYFKEIILKIYFKEFLAYSMRPIIQNFMVVGDPPPFS